MTRRQFWIGVASLYAIGLAGAFFLTASGHEMPRDTKAALALLSVPLVWGVGPIALALVWLAIKRDLSDARFGLLIFASLYIAIVALNLWWRDLL
jgi:hypothetical protein